VVGALLLENGGSYGFHALGSGRREQVEMLDEFGSAWVGVDQVFQCGFGGVVRISEILLAGRPAGAREDDRCGGGVRLDLAVPLGGAGSRRAWSSSPAGGRAAASRARSTRGSARCGLSSAASVNRSASRA
jgi:hypothetical protein